MQSSSLFSLPEHLDRLSRDGEAVDFELFRPLLVKG